MKIHWSWGQMASPLVICTNNIHWAVQWVTICILQSVLPHTVRRFHLLLSGIWPPLWPSSQSSWLQIPEVRVRSPALLDFVRSNGQEWGPFSLVSTIEEVLGRNSIGSGLEIREYGRGDPLRWQRDLDPQKLALTSPTSRGRSVGTVRFADWSHKVRMSVFDSPAVWCLIFLP
jgi:hypothetical protein